MVGQGESLNGIAWSYILTSAVWVSCNAWVHWHVPSQEHPVQVTDGCSRVTLGLVALRESQLPREKALPFTQTTPQHGPG